MQLSLSPTPTKVFMLVLYLDSKPYHNSFYPFNKFIYLLISSSASLLFTIALVDTKGFQFRFHGLVTRNLLR
jgi:hypothetical protein